MSLGLALIVLLLIPGALFFGWIRRMSRRRKLVRTPLQPAWEHIVSRNVALYRTMPADLRSLLHGITNILMAEKHFEGCGGLELSDEMRLTICAQASILLLGNTKPSYYPKAVSILVYPSTYIVHQTTRDGFIETEEHSVRLGESWAHGVVVLAWDQVKRHAATMGTGHNVVLHEFAHQLDQENGGGTGTPLLADPNQYKEWARIMSREFEHLRDGALHHTGDVIDDYGATNPAEFFAVATETFFDNPHGLKRMHSDLYDELKAYYHLDPATWIV